MNPVAVSIFIKQNGDKITISSLAADDVISKSIENMLCEQATQAIKYIDSASLCAEKIVEHQKGKK